MNTFGMTILFLLILLLLYLAATGRLSGVWTAIKGG